MTAVSRLRIHAAEQNVSVLGPGKRFVIWVQGCPRRCPGCMSPETWDPAGGEDIPVAALAQDVLCSQCGGLTVSGGEPFLQAEPLAELIETVRRSADLGVIVYTGFLYEELLHRPDAARLLALCDLLIDGPFQQEKQDGKALRGSSNQRAVMLTERYRDAIPEFGKGGCRVEFFTRPDATHMVGIPVPGMLTRMEQTDW